MFALVALVAAVSVPPCWDIFDSALRRSAASAHPAYVSYDERILVTQDDQRLVQSTAHVDYRDDGLARVSDERFNFEPFVTRHAEPGPPVLGPYGPNRDTWIPQTDVLPTIASVRTEGDMRCQDAGIEVYKGHTTYHLRFTSISHKTNRPSIKGMWVDTTSNAIWKVIVSGYVHFSDDEDAKDLADFEVELSYTGPYLVVDHVVWSYRRHEYSQVSNYFGEYTLTGYSFPGHMPASYFGDTTAARSP
jgi:hypothetical protein